jgi:hypothetical protein
LRGGVHSHRPSQLARSPAHADDACDVADAADARVVVVRVVVFTIVSKGAYTRGEGVSSTAARRRGRPRRDAFIGCECECVVEYEYEHEHEHENENETGLGGYGECVE